MGDGVIQAPISTPPFMPQQQSAGDFLHQVMQQQQDRTGMTQVGPQVPQHQVPQTPGYQNQPTHSIGAVGPGQGGAVKRQQMENFATNISNLVGQVTTKMKQKKERETQQTFDRFAGYSKGVQDAQGQIQQAKELLKKAVGMGESPEAKQMYEQGTKMLQQAQQAYQQNITNINDMTTGKNEKNLKILAKGYGVDDKNSGTPERQAAIQAIKKQNPGMGDQAASLMSKMPQQMQLGPQAQQQQMLNQAGVQGKPATQGQVLKAITDQANHAIKNGISRDEITLKSMKQGLMPEEQEGGTYKFRPMTQDEKNSYALTAKGVLAWTLKDGKPVAALRNPQTNQIIPGTENKDILPPAYLTEHIHEGEFTFTDENGKQYRVPTTSTTKPVLGGRVSGAGKVSGSATPQAGGGTTKTAPTPSGTPSPTAGMPKGTRVIGQGIQSNNSEEMGKKLAEGKMAPSQLPARGPARTAAINAATKIDPSYDPAAAEIDFKQAENPGVQSTLKYLDSLVGRPGKKGNMDELVALSDKIDRTDFPPINNVLAWAKIKAGSGPQAAYAGVVTEVADQVAKIMQGGGTGSGTSDAKMKQAQELFEKGFSKTQIKDVVAALKPLLDNRKSSLIGDNRFLKHQFGVKDDKSGVIVISPEDMK